MLEDHYDTHAAAVALVVDIGDALDLLVVDQVGDLADHLGLVDHIGNLGHNDALAPRGRMLDLGLGAHHDASAARLVSLSHSLVAVDDASGRKVGRLYVLEQLGRLDLTVVDIGARSVDHFRKIVRRHVGRHADGNTRRAVDQQQRNLRRQDRRFGNRLVEIRTEIDRILVDVGHHLVGDLAHTGLGVTHGGRTVSVDRTEVALPVHQLIAQAPLLSHAHHGLVYGRIAVRMELTEHVADDTGRLAVRLVGIEVQLVAHVVEDPAMHRLETVPHVGQRAGDDHRHRIIDVGGFHLLLDIDLNDSSFF